MLRRWRSLKKIVYAASILFITIILYAATSSDDYVQETSLEWQLPMVLHQNNPVDPGLRETFHRVLPLGPFEEMPGPVVVEPEQGEGGSQAKEPLNSADVAGGGLVEGEAPGAGGVGGQGILKPGAPVGAGPGQNPPGGPPPGGPPPGGAPPAAPVSGNLGAPLVVGSEGNAINNHAPLAPKPSARAPLGQSMSALQMRPFPDLTKTHAEMARRINYTRGVCAKLQVPNQVETDVYVLPQYNLSYCKVPKAACTYWEQVFSFLNKKPFEVTSLGIKSPFQISKYDIRHTSHFNLPRRNFKTAEDRADIMRSTRVLFVRHPLERLWSCYLEKFYLLDFWTTAGLSMKTAGADSRCPKSITFREYIDYILPLHNENWAPVTELCNPCVFQPQIIGHVETLRDDTHYILKQASLDWIFAEQDRMSREENQMLDMIIYNYQIHSIHWYSFYHRCLSQHELAAKLWDVFKKVGYLSSHAVLPDNMPDYNQTTVIRELKSQFRKYPLSPVNGRAQQLKMIKRDFEGLPKPVMAKIYERYAMDFQLFGYNASFPTS
ncbi:unnamed protein product [Lymnaea stagnalis]|uniref:Carbohydrate sulfotransferase n=1 Tax=Lymnaea stagnalis TaxID=6523 RepID=A0AAV2II46_LYMST